MPIVGLPAIGELSYNGINFNGASKIVVSSEHVRDEANQTTLYIRYFITVATVFASDSGGGTNNDLFQVRSRLSEDGKQLVFRQKGFDSLIVTPSGPYRDVRMGPKPQVLEWRPIGATRACEVVWSVETCVAECELPSRRRQVGPLAYNYEIHFDIDQHGDTTRTTIGYLEVVQTRLGNRTLSDTADRWRESLQSYAPLGFTRTQSFSLSKDKSRLDFTIVDTQIPSNNPYPKDVTDITGTHSVSISRSQGGFEVRRNVITLDVNMKRGLSGTQAWLIFLKIVQSRMLHAKQSGSSVFLDEVQAQEELFGRRCSFVATYRTLGSLKDLMQQSGLWQPLPSEWRWDQWRKSIEQEQSVRGTQNLFHNPATDVIVDLCSSPPIGHINIEEEPPRPRSRTRPILANEKPPPEQSYSKYENYIIPNRDRPSVRQAPLQPSENTSGYQPMSIPQNGEAIASPGNAFFDYGQGGVISDVIQQRGAPRFSVRMFGNAVRCGHEIERPALIAASGYALVERASSFVLTQVGVFFGVPVWKAVWDIDYLATNTPRRISPPRHPNDFA